MNTKCNINDAAAKGSTVPFVPFEPAQFVYGPEYTIPPNNPWPPNVTAPQYVPQPPITISPMPPTHAPDYTPHDPEADRGREEAGQYPVSQEEYAHTLADLSEQRDLADRRLSLLCERSERIGALESRNRHLTENCRRVTNRLFKERREAIAWKWSFFIILAAATVEAILVFSLLR